MATPSTECYCGMSQLDILKLILESDTAIFDRLSQVITTASSIGCCAEAGSQLIPSGADTVTVVFPVPFATAPVVVASVTRNAGMVLIDASVNRLSVTTTGFTADVNAAPVGNDYRLNWIAQIAT